ncbi:hypothetical protein GCM10010145_47910 [Streptomyces ruber]|uniref:Uncharacterized protein n=2 Tax=Streptomyces TaxID=1883 RepID=A0A918EU99_9ACTN|nr:hypothetical protein GCM10010145_47910 [Streptomyces ruber]
MREGMVGVVGVVGEVCPGGAGLGGARSGRQRMLPRTAPAVGVPARPLRSLGFQWNRTGRRLTDSPTPSTGRDHERVRNPDDVNRATGRCATITVRVSTVR